ncbi:signal recognition particle-docking protein FtsY [Thermanaeromonas toyohensis ToBE]|uniref:Signal recognition particle receptor FtsY n=1 Tax=Thermanaeromonas toyohensis ToBE TaxID=698762 RepID=A0A1W1VNB8_9FIRM|nr:signal recognition particle-docking protein FtsY [Thermanaeromonas toyohensis]SMB94847.1 signal recognition particle-docking protein FtsY [Thermanaeromonas toyohensis ToBE]
MQFLQRLKAGLSKTRENLASRIEKLFTGTQKIEEGFFEELEEILLGADVGVTTTLQLVDNLRQRAKKERNVDTSFLFSALREEVIKLLGEEVRQLNLSPSPPTVILVVGVNGSGKTTTAGKLAYRFSRQGKRVILAAADTFRAAAAEQLAIWAKMAGATLIRHQPGADPGAVAFDAVKAALSRQADVVLVDTAGRLHTKYNLMEELKKIRRVIERELPGAPHEVLLVLDATIGQNALAQARLFKEAAGVTGIALTKLDGTAKGGVVLAIAHELNIPVKIVGLGEDPEDLEDFRPQEFVLALFDKP